MTAIIIIIIEYTERKNVILSNTAYRPRSEIQTVKKTRPFVNRDSLRRFVTQSLRWKGITDNPQDNDSPDRNLRRHYHLSLTLTLILTLNRGGVLSEGAIVRGR